MKFSFSAYWSNVKGASLRGWERNTNTDLYSGRCITDLFRPVVDEQHVVFETKRPKPPVKVTIQLDILYGDVNMK